MPILSAIEEKTEIISFRVSKTEYEHIARVANVLFNNRKIKSDTAGALARVYIGSGKPIHPTGIHARGRR